MESGRSGLAIMIAAGLVLGTTGRAAAQTAAAKQATAAAKQATAACPTDLSKQLSGSWKAPQYRMKRGGDSGVGVFGANAMDVRDVELAVQPSGEGLLKISTSVVDEKKRTWAPTLIEVKLNVGAVTPGPGGKCAAEIKVAGAEEQFLDQTKYRAPIVGARVELLADAAVRQLDLRYETPKGQGSFWTTLTKPAAAAGGAR